MTKTAFILSFIGLVADIIGVCFLFFLRDENISKITRTQRRVPTAFGDKSKLSYEKISNMINEFNSLVDNMNNNNELRMKQSKKWLILIILGFSIQLAGLFWGYAFPSQEIIQYP